jgi:hypothetical protein
MSRLRGDLAKPNVQGATGKESEKFLRVWPCVDSQLKQEKPLAWQLSAREGVAGWQTAAFRLATPLRARPAAASL